MSVDPLALLAIAGMALATYATRIGGAVLLRDRTLGPRMSAALDAVPPAVLTAVIAPSVLAAGPAEALAGLITLVLTFRLPLLATVLLGTAALAGLRLVL
jgi:uncharacterized membrane protein